MPNHVRNRLTIIGPAHDVAQFVMDSQRPRPSTGHLPGSANHSPDPPPTRVPFDFHGVVPLPEAYAWLPYSTAGYDMEVDTWGTKWGPYRCDPSKDIHIAEHRATYTFTTAWGPPVCYYQEASRQFPQCTFLISYGGEGPCYGRLTFRRGELISTLEGDVRALPSYGTATTEEEEERQYTAYKAAESQYILTHEEWVEEMMQNTVEFF